MAQPVRVARVGAVVHPTAPAALACFDELRSLAAKRGIAITDPTAGEPADVVVALGGDGTMLRAARAAAIASVPLLGVNLGRMGFLASAEAGRLGEALESLGEGDYSIDARRMLEGRATLDDDLISQAIALNEIVLEKGTPSRTIEVDVAVGGEPVARYTADGFIVSTSTGSTAYSLSAGGPVVEPELDVMVLTPVCAHSIRWRSIVVGPSQPVVVHLVEGDGALVADGQPVAALPEGTAVTVAPRPEPLALIRLKDEGFFARFKSRFDPGSYRGAQGDH